MKTALEAIVLLLGVVFVQSLLEDRAILIALAVGGAALLFLNYLGIDPLALGSVGVALFVWATPFISAYLIVWAIIGVLAPSKSGK